MFKLKQWLASKSAGIRGEQVISTIYGNSVSEFVKKASLVALSVSSDSEMFSLFCKVFFPSQLLSFLSFSAFFVLQILTNISFLIEQDRMRIDVIEQVAKGVPELCSAALIILGIEPLKSTPPAPSPPAAAATAVAEQKGAPVVVEEKKGGAMPVEEKKDASDGIIRYPSPEFDRQFALFSDQLVAWTVHAIESFRQGSMEQFNLDKISRISKELQNPRFWIACRVDPSLESERVVLISGLKELRKEGAISNVFCPVAGLDVDNMFDNFTL